MAANYSVYAGDKKIAEFVTYDRAVEIAKAHVAEAASKPPFSAAAEISRIESVGLATADIGAAPELLAEFLAELRCVEWVASIDMDEGGYELGCPSCGGAKTSGHTDGCSLAATLAKAEGRS